MHSKTHSNTPRVGTAFRAPACMERFLWTYPIKYAPKDVAIPRRQAEDHFSGKKRRQANRIPNLKGLTAIRWQEQPIHMVLGPEDTVPIARARTGPIDYHEPNLLPHIPTPPYGQSLHRPCVSPLPSSFGSHCFCLALG